MEEVRSGKVDVAELKDVKASSSSLNKSLELNRKNKETVAAEKAVLEEVLPRSKVRRDVAVPAPPFYGSAVITSIKLEKMWEYLNKVALIRGQWQFSKKGKSEEEYNRLLESEVYPALEEQKLIIKRERLFEPKVVYGYFPCQSSGNDLIIYRPNDDSDVYTKWRLKPGDPQAQEHLIEWVRFEFPRQKADRFLCISDYFKSIDSGTLDVISVQVVTIGTKASEYTKHLFEAGSYQNYLYLHGLVSRVPKLWLSTGTRLSERSLASS